MDTQTPPADGSLTAGLRLRRLKGRILDAWTKRVREAVPGATAVPPPTLVDSIPQMLDHLADMLEDPAVHSDTLDQERPAWAVQHGRQRASVEGYSVERVVREHDLLRQVIIELMEIDGRPIASRDRDVILAAVHAGIADAVREFVQLQEAARTAAHTSQMERTEERFRRLVEGVKDYAIFTVSPSGHITSWNWGAERMKGYSTQEILGQHFSVLYPPEGKRRNEPADHLKAAAIEGRFRGEGIRVRKNGDHFTADVLITPMHEDGQLVGFSKVVQDLTERNMLLQERDLSREHLETLRTDREARERFVATLTHDLRSPLNAAKAGIDLIIRYPDQTEKVRGWAERVSKVIDRASEMISDLLDANRARAGETVPLVFEACDAAAIAQGVVDEVAGLHGASITMRAEGGTRGLWNPEGLRRVLDNLLINAVKYGDPGGPISVLVRQVQDRVIIAVHNRGSIIPAEEQAKLFQPFHRTPSAEASGKRGWGLGLTVVQSIVQAHRGVVKVESYPREGTIFTVDLPLDPRDAPVPPGT